MNFCLQFILNRVETVPQQSVVHRNPVITMVLKSLPLIVTILRTVTPDLICELSDCSIPGVRPAHPNCTEDHFTRLNLMPVADQPSSKRRIRGSLLDVSASVTDPSCVIFSTQFSNFKDPAKPRKLVGRTMCQNTELYVYALSFGVVRVSGGRLRCMHLFYNVTDQCKALRGDLLRVRVAGRSVEVENLDLDGEIVGKMKFVERNGTFDPEPECDCKEFDGLARRYIDCLVDSAGEKLIAYGVAAGFIVVILGVIAIYSLSLKGQDAQVS